MLLGRCQLALRMFLFSSPLAFICPCDASAAYLDPKAQGLAHYIMAVCHEDNGQDAQAISEYQESIKFNGLQAAPRIKLGAYYLHLGKNGQATEQLRTAVRLSPDDPQAHYFLALAYTSDHQYDLAASEYEALLKLASMDQAAYAEVHMYLGQLYYAENKYPDAIGQFRKILDFDPQNTSALFLLGSVYEDKGDHVQSINIFRKILQIDAQNSEALNSLAYVYAEEGVHLDQAITMARQAIEIDPANGAYYDSLGWAFYKKGSYHQALEALQKAASFIEDEILYDHLGDVYKALKEYALACQYWHKSLGLDPHQVSVQQKLNELEKWMASQSARQLN